MALYGKIRDQIKKPFRTAVIVAAGSPTRLGQDKLMLPLGGVPVLARTLRAFEACTMVDEIIIVTREDRLMELASLRDTYGITKLTQVVVGGATRAGSSLAGVMAASKKATLIAIHDGARPLVTLELIEAVFRKAEQRQAAAPVLPLKDTVKERSGDMLVKTPPRESLAAVQTPQAFRAELIRAALTEAMEQKLAITDDCSAVEAIGLPVAAVDGEEENIKITTAIDVVIAEEIIRRREA
jgi:2-C-methyl-D-erythritol 4-phosphate cytidylyltransferase